jgi:hypothetical protein
MTGFVYVLGPCFGCCRVFAFNADLVPSIRHEGVKQPICQDCVDTVNPQRVANGLDPIVVRPGAYQPQEV